MRKITMMILAAPMLCLAACGAQVAAPPSSPGGNAPIEGAPVEPNTMPAMDSIPESANPIANTQVDENLIRLSFRTLDLAASAVDLLVTFKIVVPGTPRALTIATGLDTARNWLNAASSAQRLGNSRTALEAYTKAGAAIAAVQAAIKGAK